MPHNEIEIRKKLKNMPNKYYLVHTKTKITGNRSHVI